MSYKNLNITAFKSRGQQKTIYENKLENKMLKFQRQMEIFISDVENL